MSVRSSIASLSLASTILKRKFSTSSYRAADFITQDAEEEETNKRVADRKAELRIRRLGRQAWNRRYFTSNGTRYRRSLCDDQPDGSFPEAPQNRWQAFANTVSAQREAFALGGKIRGNEVALDNLALFYQEGQQTR